MKRVLSAHQKLLDYNYLVEHLDEHDNKNHYGCLDYNKPCSEKSIVDINNLLIAIIDKSKMIIGEQSVSKLCRLHNIYLKDKNQITIKNDICVTLNKFIENLVTKGGNIIKIMLHNLSHEINKETLELIFSDSNHSFFYC